MTDKEKLKLAVDALQKLARLGNEPHLGNSDGNIIAQEALATIGAFGGTGCEKPHPTLRTSCGVNDYLCPDCQPKPTFDILKMPEIARMDMSDWKGPLDACAFHIANNAERNTIDLAKIVSELVKKMNEGK